MTAALQLVCGCAAISKGFNLIVNPDAEKLQSKIVWNKPSARIAPSSDRSLFVVFEDMTGEDIPLLEIEDAMMANFENRGYRIVDDPLKAHYTVSVTLRYFGINPEANGGRSKKIAAGIGAIAGGSLGYALTSSQKSSVQVPVIVGGSIIGGLTGAGIRARMQVKEYDLIADVAVGKRLPKPVTVTVEDARDEIQGTGFGKNLEGGDLHESATTNETQRRSSEYQVEKTHDMRLSRVTAWARKARLDDTEALEAVIPKMQRALDGVLPRQGRRGGPRVSTASNAY